ncbi:putative hydrolase or acyltransferase of alpha/beta superfamily [Aequorivita sublithincola DSM 14238]|uniref:Putative hydrolase or acyltransferase of alpha/beta superfamily n=1 Tax=Aequorivita sublithincola (strain DSM 14238 / LMG 21431 / ACAM 643 / 9-3) TaxID=746697 RepID=I3YWR1_AEQSU|nr:alpha/beta hydrolase [Aequorivita sublithincola]AFL81429.1 putative hydrolase or acyltransferase of alpha/beta superfamily [Aequorivita sublithincola DSM 14238]
MKHTKVAGTAFGTIIFIHGNSSSSKIFKETLTYSEIKNTKIAVDLPGHGTSRNDFKGEPDFSAKSYQQQLISFIEKIDDEILLVGNSMGGHLALEIAPKIKRLKGLVIFGTPPVKKPINFEEAFVVVPALQTFFTENPTDVEIAEAAKLAVHNVAHAEQITVDFKNTHPKVRNAIAFDLMNDNLVDEAALFVSLNIKKFIISGNQDPTVNHNYLKKLCEQCGESCTFISIENCGHFPSLEQPTEFNKAIAKIANQVF